MPVNELRLTNSAKKKLEHYKRRQEQVYFKILKTIDDLIDVDYLGGHQITISKNIQILKKSGQFGWSNETLYSCRITNRIRMIFSFSSESRTFNILDFVEHN